jgi:hypothetical protein
MKKLYVLYCLLSLPIIVSKANLEPNKISNENEFTKKVDSVKVESYDSIVCASSVYTLSADETDNTPTIAAGGKIDTNLVNSGKVRYIAIAWNMHKRYGGEYKFGDTINVHSDSWRFSGKFIIKDLLNPRYKNKIDFLKPKFNFVYKINSKGRRFKQYKFYIPQNVHIIVKK